MRFEFHVAADKHGISHEDAEHAIRNAVRISYMENGAAMAIGSATNGVTMLEVGFRELTDGTFRVFHAMQARPIWG